MCRQVKCLAYVWMYHAPHHTVDILLSKKENVAPRVMVSIFYIITIYSCYCLFCQAPANILILSSFLQSVSMIIRRMLMEKCSVLPEVDPACSAGVRQVPIMHSKRTTGPIADISSKAFKSFYHTTSQVKLFHCFNTSFTVLIDTSPVCFMHIVHICVLGWECHLP